MEKFIMTIIPPVKGTRDFYPDQMFVRKWLYDSVRQVSELFGYQEWDSPMLEYLDLYAAKSGEELVKDQSYVFDDRGGEKVTLRPELTPSLARLVAQKQKELIFPIRWWSWGPFWRYERPQKGRTREFFQWNVDLLGGNTPEADAEVVAILATFFRSVGLSSKQVSILVNNRRLIEAQLEKLGIPSEKYGMILSWIDRRTTLEESEWESFGKDKGLTNEEIVQIMKILDKTELWKEWGDFVCFFNAIDAFGVREFVKYDPSIMRGLLYYTGMVFEAWDIGRDVKKAINGGGRYDNLLSDVGGGQLPAVGFAMGDVVISLLLKKYGLLPDISSQKPIPIVVTVFSPELVINSLELASSLRAEGFNVICYTDPVKLQKQFKFADRMNIPIVLVLGPEEVSKGNVTIKELAAGNQITVPKEDVPFKIRTILEDQ